MPGWWRSAPAPTSSRCCRACTATGAIPEAAYRHALSVLRPQLQGAYRRSLPASTTSPPSCFRRRRSPAAPIGDDETVALNGERVPTFFTFIRNTSPGSVAGIPGISLPAAMTASGLPLGLELDGPEGGDTRLLAIARGDRGRVAEDCPHRRT